MDMTDRSSVIIMDEFEGIISQITFLFIRNMSHIIMLSLKNSQNLLRS